MAALSSTYLRGARSFRARNTKRPLSPYYVDPRKGLTMPELVNHDDHVFGTWVYCAQHLRAHQTGWCGVDSQDKVGLGEFTGNQQEQARAANEKCLRLGLKIHNPSK